jgi:undecaprenyl-phosphate 4-deoxy-4-formamido-L-arabinose transferase
MIKISIVVPIYNSTGTIVELNRRISDALRNVAFELILSDDGSGDDSWKVIKELTVRQKNVIGIRLRKNTWQDNALMAGLSLAQGEFVVIMDDDLQHSPYDIPALLNKCEEGFDVCYAHFQKKKQVWWKNLGSWFNGKIASIVLKKPRHIYLSPFQIIRKEVVAEILKYRGPYPYIQGLLLQVTNNIAQMYVEHHERCAGKSNFNIIRSISLFLSHLTSFSVIPLRISAVLGFFVALAGFLLSIFYIVSFFTLQHVVEGWTTLILTTLILGGLILMSIGLIGEYLGRLYLCVNDRPQYSIKEITKYNG